MIIKGDNRLSPEERYLVLALYVEIVLYQNEIVNVEVSTLVSDFGATTKVVKNVVEYLVKKKNIKLVNLPSKARQLIFSQDDIATLVEEWTKLPSWKQDSILGLFEPEKRKILIPKKIEGSSSNVGGLRNSNLLLMFIFIFHSNNVGLVKDLTHRSIERMMGGISKDRLKSQMKSLNKFGFFRAESMGGTSRIYFKKTNKRYMIDLLHLKAECELIKFNGVNFLNPVIKLIKIINYSNILYVNEETQNKVSKLDKKVFENGTSIINSILRSVENIINLNLREEQIVTVLEVNKKYLNQKNKDLKGGENRIYELGVSEKKLVEDIHRSILFSEHISLPECQVMFDFLVSLSDDINTYFISMIRQYYEVNAEIKNMSIFFHELIYTRNENLFSYKCAIDFQLNESSVMVDMYVERINLKPSKYQYTLKSKGLRLRKLEVKDVAST